MIPSYINQNGKKVSGNAALLHFIAMNGGYENHNRKIATYGAKNPKLFLSFAQQIAVLISNNIPKITSKKTKKKR